MLSFGSVNLWALERQDLGQHYRWANDDTLRRLAGAAPTPRSMPAIQAWYETIAADPSQEIYSIKTAEAEMLGWIHLYDIDFRNGSASTGLVIDPAYWRQGYGLEALAAAIEHAFFDLRLVRIQAEVLSMNTPSRGLFEKLGFMHEGTKREAYYTSGRYLNVEIYALLIHEYKRPILPD